jgi:hypothetical protein
MSFTYGSHISYSSTASYGGWGQFLSQQPVTEEFSRRLHLPNVTPVFLLSVQVTERIRPIINPGVNTYEFTPIVQSRPPDSVIYGRSGALTQNPSWSPPMPDGEWDYDGGKLWLNPISREDAADGFYQAAYTLRYSSAPKTFRDLMWHPRIESVPNISLRIEPQFGGVGQVGGGSIVLNNGDGEFDLLSELVWSNGTAVLEIGFDLSGDEMDESDYQTVGKWGIDSVKLTEETFTLNLTEAKGSLNQEVPREIFTREEFPSINNDDVGKVIPRIYGRIFGSTPIVIDRSARKFKVAHHAIRSLDGVRIKKAIENVAIDIIISASFDPHSGNTKALNESREVINVTFDGADLTEQNSIDTTVATAGSWHQEGGVVYVNPPSGETVLSGEVAVTVGEQFSAWQTADFATVDLHKAEFTLGSEWDREAEVAVDVSGRTNPDGTLMVNGADIVADFLDYTGSIELDAPSFEASKRFYHVGYIGSQERCSLEPCLYLDEKQDATKTISEINKVLGSFLYVDGAGRWKFSAFVPQQGQLLDRAKALLPRVFTDADVIEGTFEKVTEHQEIFSRIKVKYGKRHAEDWSQTLTESKEENEVIYGLTDNYEREIEVCLSSKHHARHYAQRLLTTDATARNAFRFELPWKGLFLMPGDQFRLQTDRLQDIFGITEPSDRTLEVIEVQKDYANGRVVVTAGDRRGWRDTFGHWLGDLGEIVSAAPTDRFLEYGDAGQFSSGLVQVWQDLSGNGRHAIPGDSNVPVMIPNQINGYGSLYWHGIRKHLRLPSMTGLTQAELFMVLQLLNDPGLGSSNTGWDMGNTPYPQATKMTETTGTILEGFRSTVRHTIPNPTPSLTSWRIYNVISTATEYTVNLDNVEQYTTATNTPGFLPHAAPGAALRGGVIGGRLGLSGVHSDYINGLYIASMIIFPRKLTSGERTAMHQELSDKFALGVISPAGPPPVWDSGWTEAQVHEARQNAGFWSAVSGNFVPMAHNQDRRSDQASRWW